MNNERILRTYGTPPYAVILVHGGPGAGGEMAPVARRLSLTYGVAEPIQTETSLVGQVEELRALVEYTAAKTPVTLVGYSWGAWLSWLVAAKYPSLVKKLILISSGPFEQAYVEQLAATRQSRLTPVEREEMNQLLLQLSTSRNEGTSLNERMARLGQLAHKTDEFSPDPIDDLPNDRVDVRGNIYQNVWDEAAAMRRDGRLLQLAGKIQCPVTAFHGDYDPHPAEGVRKPLQDAGLPDFRFILVKNCGHTPWNEREAREDFYVCLAVELRGV
jgi:pimeloyl-ACP methyl ester carboxylesterase